MFNGLESFMRSGIKHTNKILKSNEAINPVMATAGGARLALTQRIRNNKGLKDLFVSKNEKGQTKQLSNLDLASSLFFNKKGELSKWRTGTAAGVGIAGVIDFIFD